MKNHIKSLSLGIISLAFLLTCAVPTKLDTNPDHAEIFLITTTTPAQGYYPGDTAALTGKVWLGFLVDSCKVTRGGGGFERTFFRDTVYHEIESVTVKIPLTTPGNTPVLFRLFMQNGNTRDTTLTIVVNGFAPVLKPVTKTFYQLTTGVLCTLVVELQSGTLPVHYQWVRGELIRISDSLPRLIVGPVVPADSGIYRCIASNQWGKADTCKDILIFITQQTITKPDTVIKTDTTKIVTPIQQVTTAPKWKTDTLRFTIAEGQSSAKNLADTCTRATGDTLAFKLFDNQFKGATLSTVGHFSLVAGMDDSGHYKAAAIVSGKAGADTAVVEITILNVNRLPVFLDSLPKTSYQIKEGEALSIRFKAKDADNDKLIYFVNNTNLPQQKYKVQQSDTALTWQSTVNDGAPYTLKLGVTDGKDSTYANIDIAVGNVNLPPQISVAGIVDGGTVLIKETDTLRFKVTAVDPNMGDSATLLQIKNAPFANAAQGWGTFDTVTGLFRYVPSFTMATRVKNTTLPIVQFFAKDKKGLLDTFNVVVTVSDSNTTPTAIDTAVSLNEGDSISFHLPVGDADGDALMLLVTTPVDAALGQTTTPTGNLSPAKMLVTLKSKSGSFGTCLFKYQVSDGVKSSQVSTVAIQINHVNHTPTITLSGPTPGAHKILKESTNLVYSGTDLDNDILSYFVVVGEDSAGLFTTGQKRGPLTLTQYDLSGFTSIKSAQKYYWAVIVADNGGLKDTTDIWSFTTKNNPPVWTALPATGDTNFFTVTWDLSKYCSDVDGHQISFSLPNNNNSVSISGKTMTFHADTSSITILAKDDFIPEPCSTRITFKSYTFVTPKMKLIPAGSFTMGSDYTGYFAEERPSHQITISRSFWIDSTEATQEEYRAYMMDPKSGLATYTDPPWTAAEGVGPNYPAYLVTWYDAVLYCNAKSKKLGLDTVYTYSRLCTTPGNRCDTLGTVSINYAKNGFRLPTEAEWEYAYRANITSDYYWSGIQNANPKDYAWYDSNSTNKTHPVAQKIPNSRRLYDMSGNVWEWTNDWHDPLWYQQTPSVDPTGPQTGVDKIHRGGGCLNNISTLRASYRADCNPLFGYSQFIGIRVIRYAQ